MIREEILKNIQQHAVPPPTMVWDKIASELDAASGKQLTVAYKKRSFPMKAQIAAAMLLIIGTAILLFQLRQKKEAVKMVAAAKSDSSAIGGVTIYPSPVSPEYDAASPSATIPNRLNNSIPDGRNGNQLAASKVQFATMQRKHLTGTPDTRSLEKILMEEPLADSNLINENYFYITSKDGHQVRVSKKIAPVVLEDWGIYNASERNTPLELNVLSHKISQWKTKIARSAFIPAASNLMDLLYFIDLQED